jgi:hypothetical protein
MTPSFKTTDCHALRLFASAFPKTRFRKVRIHAFKGPMSLNSYWDSGYRDYFAVVAIANGRPLGSVPQNGTPFDGKNLELSDLPSGFALAVHHYAGIKEYGSLHLNPADLTPMLPAPQDASLAAAYECSTSNRRRRSRLRHRLLRRRRPWLR